MSGIPAEGVKAFLTVHWTRTAKKCSKCSQEIPAGEKYFGMDVQPDPEMDVLHTLRHFLCESCSPVEPGTRIPFPWEGRPLGRNWRTEYLVAETPLRYGLLKGATGRQHHVAELRSLVRVQAQSKVLCEAYAMRDIQSNYSLPADRPQEEARWLENLVISPKSVVEAPPGINVLYEAQITGTVCGRCRNLYEEIAESWNLL